MADLVPARSSLAGGGVIQDPSEADVEAGRVYEAIDKDAELERLKAAARDRWTQAAGRRSDLFAANGAAIRDDFRQNGDLYVSQIRDERDEYLSRASSTFLKEELPGAEDIFGMSSTEIIAYAGGTWAAEALLSVGTIAGLAVFYLELWDQAGGTAWLERLHGLDGKSMARGARDTMDVVMEEVTEELGIPETTSWWRQQLAGLMDLYAESWGGAYQDYLDQCSIWTDMGWFFSGGLFDALFGPDISLSEHCSHKANEFANKNVWAPFWVLVKDLIRGTMLEGAYGPTSEWIWRTVHGGDPRGSRSSRSTWWSHYRGNPLPLPLPRPPPPKQEEATSSDGGLLVPLLVAAGTIAALSST